MKCLRHSFFDGKVIAGGKPHSVSRRKFSPGTRGSRARPGLRALRKVAAASVREALREPLRIVDIHPHVISTDETHYPRAPIGGHQSDWSRERPVPYEKMITAMDAAGIAKTALVQASTRYRHHNSHVADAAAAPPRRLPRGVFCG